MPETQPPAVPRATNAIVLENGDILFYGVIGDDWDGLDAASVITQIEQLGSPEQLTIRIDSPGGLVTEGMAIYNYLKRHPARVVVHVDALAASMASFIAMAGDEIIMPEPSVMMIHNPASIAMGEARDLRTTAEYLDKLKDIAVSVYAERSGLPPTRISEMMDATTFMTAREAFDLGFCTKVEGESTEPDNPTALMRFRNVPEPVKALFPAQAASAAVNSSKEFPMPNQTQADTQHQAPAQTSAAPQGQPQAQAPTQAPQASAAPSPTDAEARGRQFVLDVRAECRKAKLSDEVTDRIMAEATTMEGARAMIIDAWASQDPTPEPQNQVRVQMGADAVDKFRTGVEKALLTRAGMEGGERNEFTGMTLRELARASLDIRGVKLVGVDTMSMAGIALNPMMHGYHANSDFVQILGNIASKSMLKGHTAAAETFQLWTGTGTLTDFKIASRVDLNSFPSLDRVEDGAEYNYATVGERGETVQLATYGKMFAITRQTIINDDLDAFTKIPGRMGGAAIRTVGNLVYAVLTGNPKMSDNVALFHATHKNLAGTGAAPSVDSLSDGKAAMALQKGAGDNDTLNIRPQYMLVPVALEGSAKTLIASENVPGDAGQVPNIHRNTLEVVSEARLDAHSAKAWYLAASAGVHDTIEVQYLDGVQTPTLEQQAGWNVDGVEFKVRIDAGVKALDFRTLYKNPGPAS